MLHKVLLILAMLGLATVSVNAQHDLLETARAKKIASPGNAASDIKVVSYNIRWRGGAELQKLARLLKEDPEIGGASIIGLQEVDRHKRRTGKRNSAKILADELDMHYAWTAPPSAKAGAEEETGVVILSSYPLADVRRLVLPHEGPGKRRRVALGATVQIGSSPVRVYSVHAENRVSVTKKLEQMKAVLQDLATFPNDMPAVVLGDFNTWELDAGKKTIKLFNEADFQTPLDGKPTFSQQILFVPIKLKLDWIWLRKLSAVRQGIDREIGLSDHWPLWVVLDLKTSTVGN